MGGADQAPFAVDRLEAASGEASVAAIRFHVAEDGFDRALAPAVSDLVRGVGQLGFHLLANKGRIGKPTSVRGDKLSDLQR